MLYRRAAGISKQSNCADGPSGTPAARADENWQAGRTVRTREKTAVTATRRGRQKEFFMSKQIETEVRCLKASELRVAGGAGDDMQIEGYAALFNSQSNDLG